MSLSDAELITALRDGTKVPVPYFGGSPVELFFEDEEELLCFADAIRSFLAQSEADRVSATSHVFAYFRDVIDDVGSESVESGMEALTSDSPDIWRFVYPTVLSAQESWELTDHNKLRHYVVVEANCGWEQEHGLLMSWRDGRELVKVSGYDGHATNGHAYDDLSKDAWVYHSWRTEMSTRNPLVKVS